MIASTYCTPVHSEQNLKNMGRLPVHFCWVLWMSPETVKAMMPNAFGKLSVIIECLELRCQTPSSLIKSHTTVKD